MASRPRQRAACIVVAALAVSCGGDAGEHDAAIVDSSAASEGPDAALPRLDGGPVVVGACDDLGAVGTFENITPEGVELEPPYTGTLVVITDPQHAGSLYVTTSRRGIYRSDDCGAHWTKVNTGRNGDQIDLGLVWSAVIDPTDANTIYALTGYGPAGLWKSTNGGVDWDQVIPSELGVPGFVARVGIDPVDPLHVMVNFHDDRAAPHTPVCFAETRDGGATWRVIDFPSALRGAWGEGTSIFPLDATHWICVNGDLFYTADAGVSWALVTPGGSFGAGYIQGDIFRGGPDDAHYVGSSYGVLVSHDVGASWTSIPSSGGGLTAVVGDGTRLFDVMGFQPPGGDDFMWSAPYSDTSTWRAVPMTGMPARTSGATSLAADTEHHVVYVAVQGDGLWRVVTE